MKQGIYLVLLTALISGFSIFSNKIFVSQADPLAFTTIRNVLVLGFLSFILWQSGKFTVLKSLQKKDWLKLITIGALGGGLAFALFFTGLSQIGAVQGSLIHKTLFLWVTLLAIPLLGERLHKIQLIGYGVILFATFALGGSQILVFNSGSLLVLAATLLWAVENVLAKTTLKNVPAEVVGWARIALGLPVLLLITLVMGKGTLLVSEKTLLLWPLLTSSLFLTGYIYTWYKGLKFIPVTLATSILVVAPVITNFLTALFITKQLPEMQIMQGFLLTIGVAFLLTRIILPRKLPVS
ncbi:TPA: hypothetical protein DIV55_02775 [Patescibacteria group bacterium]|uniref:EamA domain-containing protein n=1 Tax=Candidatus Gottesmanbacteria bacterium GW2011_GWA1_43_11 TaxID=1618436 RepID=A0A0G1CHD0_9BACT|nr:MAG: hypothetical protein UV59_C0012G0020 [Candidatus Gottesmanbacteria bacterium GW2011_GWA1_43_11]HCS78644.1 hypothetical protein [Patescibacteria group bacterium]